MRFIMRYVRPHIGLVILGLIIKFSATMAELFLPFLLELIIDKSVPQKDMTGVVVFGLLMVVCSLIALFGNISANRLSAQSAGRATRKIRLDLFTRLSHLSSRKCDELTESSLVSRLTSDTYNVNNFIGRMLRMGVRAPILLIGGIILTMTLDSVLSLVLVSMLPLVGIVVYFVTRYGVPIYTRVQERVDALVKAVQENITGIRVIKALSKTDYEIKRFSAVNEELSETERTAANVMALSNPLNTLILNIGLVAVVIVGAYRIDAGLSRPGVIIAFLSYFTIMLNAMLGITRIFILYTKGMASSERIREVIESDNDMPIYEKNGALCDIESEYHIEFSNVSFSYNGKENNLSNISFALKKGQSLGIIGSTGSGKSTVVSLLMRFYDVGGGSIRINGEDVRTIDDERLHTMFGAAFQSDFLFAGTLRDNVDYFRGLSDEEILRAADTAQARELIDSLSDGLSHMITSNGSNLSGGQRQRLLITRALAGNPDILILDDSSSALDYKTDSLLRKKLAECFSDVTTVIIAQRISSVMNADVIMVLEDGRVIGQGTHSELLSECESYRKIYELQMGARRGETI